MNFFNSSVTCLISKILSVSIALNSSDGMYTMVPACNHFKQDCSTSGLPISTIEGVMPIALNLSLLDQVPESNPILDSSSRILKFIIRVDCNKHSVTMYPGRLMAPITICLLGSMQNSFEPETRCGRLSVEIKFE